MAQVQVIIGPARSDREKKLNNLWLQYPDSTLIVVPSRRYAQQRTRHLLRQGNLPGVMGRPVITFPDLVSLILSETGSRPTPLSDLANGLLVQQAMREAHNADELCDLGDTLMNAGFVHHVQHVISQLKQGAIEPQEFREIIDQHRELSPIDEAVVAIYQRYQDGLLNNETYDLQGLYWRAREICEQKKPDALGCVNSLLIDGFDDFTHSEINLLISLKPHLDHVTFGFAASQDPDRADAYAVVLQTIARIEQVFTTAPMPTPEPAPIQSLAQFVHANLLGRNRATPTADLREDLTLVQCHNPTHEIEAAARNIKRLIARENIPPDRIALTARSLTPYCQTVLDVFSEFGIPVSPQSMPPVSQSAWAAAVLTLYDIAEAWSPTDVLTLLMEPWFPAADDLQDHHRSTFHTLANLAHVVEGRKQWFSRMQHLHTRLAETEEFDALQKRVPHLTESARLFLHQLDTLAGYIDALPQSASAPSHAEELRKVLEQIPYLEFAGPDSFHDPAAAWQGVDAAIEECRQAGDPNALLTRIEFAALLKKAFALQELPIKPTPGGVPILPLDSLRHLQFQYVFFVGANALELPQRPAHNALYSSMEREKLHAIGISLEQDLAHTQREYLLFLRLFAVHSKRLVISWHTNAPDGQERPRSLMVDELIGLFPKGRLPLEKPDTHIDTVAPDLKQAASWRDITNRIFSQGASHTLPEEAPGRHAVPLAALEKDRYDYTSFGEYDGIITDPDILGEIGNSYNPDHLYSVRQLETYVDCPFRFFMEHILKVERPRDATELIDPALRGLLYHDALESFHRQFRGIPVQDIPEDSACKAMQQAIDQTIQSARNRNTHIPSGLWNAESLRMTRSLSRYLELERDPEKPKWKPSHFEVAFGDTLRDDADELSSTLDYTFDADGEPVRLRGRIDRIDVDDRDRARIVDYKTSTPPSPKAIITGTSLQLTLYALVLENLLLPDAVTPEAVFLHVGANKHVEALCKEPSRSDQVAWDERLNTARRVIRETVERIRAGHFSPTQENSSCKGCAANKICRYEKARMARKTSP